MTDETLKLMTAIAAIIAAVAGPTGVVLAAYLTIKLNRVERNVDGKLTNLLEAREDAAGARGEIKERDANRAYHDEGNRVTSQVKPTTEADPLKVQLVKKGEES